MNVNTDSVINQLFSGGTALAGLVLVFLGGVLAAFDSYETQQKNAVRDKYKKRAWLSLLGFSTALIAAVCAFVANWFPAGFWIIGSTIALGIAFFLVVIMAVKAVTEIS